MKKILMAIVAILTIISLSAGTVYAWDFTVAGAAVCNTTTGDWDIKWTVNNPEPEDLTVTASDRTSVPVGSTVAKQTSKDFKESLPGTTTGDTSLTIKVEWPSDNTQPPKTAKVTLDGTCKKPPVTVTTGGMGAGTVKAAATVKVPAGPINAGQGAATSTSLGALFGLAGSLALLVFGLRRVSKQSK